MKIRLRQQVVFDGQSFPAGHVFDTNDCPVSAECLIQREWGDQVDDDTPASEQPVAEAPAQESDKLSAQEEIPAAPAPAPAVSEQKPKRSRK